jgi:hypothetical protein
VFRLDYLGLIYFDPVYGPDPCEPPYAPLNIGTLIPPQSKVDVTYTPDTSDGLSYNEAIGAYYFGGGKNLSIPFDVVDQPLNLTDFKINVCQDYPNGGPIEVKTKAFDLGDISSDIAGPGRVVFEIIGSIQMSENGCWTFDGTISMRNDDFNFDPKPFGERDGPPSFIAQKFEDMLIEQGSFDFSSSSERLLADFLQRYHMITYLKEGVTRVVHDLDKHTFISGKEFTVTFPGVRDFHETGKCEKP